MSVTNGKISRRLALQRLGATGGAGITLGAMAALGLIAPEPTKVAFQAPERSDFTLTGRAAASVLILGAGIAGLTSAYELEKAGYHCQILEARDRPGGRNWTARHGTSETSTDGVTQTCRFDPGLYMNVGPTRIAQHHTTLDYCRELKIPIHMFGNQNADAYFYFEGDGPLSAQRIRHRAVQADSRGYIAELLAKAINQQALDQDLSASDKAMLIEFLRATGVLSPTNKYLGGPSRGFHPGSIPRAGLQAGNMDAPFRLSDIFALNQASFFNPAYFFAFESEWDQAMPMFEPDGGIDIIPKALAGAIKGPMLYGAQVTHIENTASDTQISYRNQDGHESQVQADYCICTIPPHLLTRIPNNFSAQVNADLAVPLPYSAGKMGLQFRRRFWEEDDRIFSGITTTNLDIVQIIYPSYGYFEQKGVVIGYYNYQADADAYGALTPKQREQRALAQGRKIHGEAYQREFETSFSNHWRKTRFSEGSWVTWPDGTQGDYNTPYGRLLAPAGRIYFAGDYLSYAIGWQHGAFESARKVVMDLHARVLTTTTSRA
ncbi:MAG TPA: FAD-dependent oxidoreductase [Ktedonosporobacter sp.]|nr:FAD-dependent oxidoreductase [Ktedonosporobacter sp.]